MRNSPNALTAEQWFHNLFSAKTVHDGGVVRRKLRDVERMVGLERFAREIERRGFTALLNGGQVIVLCNAEPVRRLTRPTCAPPSPRGAANSRREFAPNPR